MVNKLILLFFSLFAITQNCITQSLAAYVDYKGYLYAFDDGLKIKLYHQEIQSHQVGYKNIAYLNNDNEFWVYENQKQKKVGDYVLDYKVTDNLIAFKSANNLYVYDDGMALPLSNNCKKYFPGDSLVGFYDDFSNTLEVYYNKEVTQLERNLDIGSYLNTKVGENILTYFSNSGHFNAFFIGQSFEILPPNTTGRVQLGLNTIAYEDRYEEIFYGFINGKTYEIENNLPQHFTCGDNMVVYLSYEDEFIQFSNGNKTVISSFPPDFYNVTDDMVVYSENGYFKVFYQGVNYELENFIPSNYQVEEGAIAYLDQQGLLHYFSNRTKKKISAQKVTHFSLEGQTLHYDLDQNNHKILYKDKVY